VCLKFVDYNLCYLNRVCYCKCVIREFVLVVCLFMCLFVCWHLRPVCFPCRQSRWVGFIRSFLAWHETANSKTLQFQFFQFLFVKSRNIWQYFFLDLKCIWILSKKYVKIKHGIFVVKKVKMYVFTVSRSTLHSMLIYITRLVIAVGFMKLP
jgi:hypothetical protein